MKPTAGFFRILNGEHIRTFSPDVQTVHLAETRPERRFTVAFSSVSHLWTDTYR